MIPIPSGVRVWIAAGHTDMRCGMNSLALRIQQSLRRDPHAGDLYVFRGKSGKLIKIFWHDGLGASLYAKRLEQGRFIWPTTKDDAVVITPAQLSYLLEGDRLAQPATYVAAAERRIGFKKCWPARQKKAPQIAGFMIPSAS